MQPALISLNFVRPVTPKVAGSSPVAPARWMPAVVQNSITCTCCSAGEVRRGVLAGIWLLPPPPALGAHAASAASRVASWPCVGRASSRGYHALPRISSSRGSAWPMPIMARPPARPCCQSPTCQSPSAMKLLPLRIGYYPAREDVVADNSVAA